MDTGTKQRLIGAAVLIALAVIFLPMLVQGPAPDSGAADVPLTMPDAPQGDIETRDLPLVGPGDAPAGGALGGVPAPVADGDRLPTVDTDAPRAGNDDAVMQPAGTAAGDYAVHFGAYATSADADTLVRQLRQSQLPGYREQTTLNGRPAWRVRIGPYATRVDAETARLRAAHVRDDVGARVVVLDADAAAPVSSASQPMAKPAVPAVATEALPSETAKPVASQPAVPPKPTQAAPNPAVSKPAAPAASGVGFAVQVGAFGNAAEAGKLRDRLRAAGFSAFTETVNSDKGALTRVRVGPVADRAAADALRAQVGAKAGVNGIVRPHP